MIVSLVYWALRRLVELIALAFRSSGAKEVEIVALRHQLHVLRRQVGRPRLHDVDRALLAALSVRLARPNSSLLLVRPDRARLASDSREETLDLSAAIAGTPAPHSG